MEEIDRKQPGKKMQKSLDNLIKSKVSSSLYKYIAMVTIQLQGNYIAFTIDDEIKTLCILNKATLSEVKTLTFKS